MILRCLFIAVIFLSLPVRACPEEDRSTDLVFEKVYLHLDRYHYLSGEDVWYKAYLVDAKWNQLTDNSGVLYVELVSPELEIIDQQLVRLEAGTGYGDIHLGDSLPTGTYLVRAYTNWMRNAGRDFYYHREIWISNPFSPEHEPLGPSRAEKDMPDVQFFPEGGSLLAGVPTRVCFKAVDANGCGCPVEGFIITMDGDTCARFESIHLGMGSFNLAPEKGTRYQAIITGDSGPALKYDLPGILDEGYVINISHGIRDELTAIIKTNRQTLARQDTLPVYLQVKTGEGNFLTRMGITHPAQSITLHKKSFPPGIAHLILYDADFKPHCERLVYLDPPAVRVSVRPHKPVYSPNEKTSLKIRVSDGNDVPVPAELSLAAVDASAVPNANNRYPSHFRSYLYLESELRGIVEEPGYYFSEANPDRESKLDLLLLTQGWRDFLWKYPADTTIEIIYPAEKGLTISGSLLSASGRKALEGASISMVITGENNTAYYLTTTDSLGRYAFRDLDIRGSERLMVSAVDKNGHPRGIIHLDTIQRPEVDVHYTWHPVRIQQQDETGEFLGDAMAKINIMKQYSLSDTIPIDEVVIRTWRRAQKDEHQRIYSKPDNVVEVREHERYYRDIFELIQGRVPGVMVSGVYPDYQILIRGVSNLRGDIEPLYLLDGMPVSREIIMDIPVRSVDKVEVLKEITNTSMYGSRGANGVISVLTKTRGNPADDTPVLYSISGEIRGYREARIFYAPRYDQPRTEHQPPDLRTTIHWEPSLDTGEDGVSEISFYNADPPATVYITVEGITRDGIPLYFGTSYRVN